MFFSAWYDPYHFCTSFMEMMGALRVSVWEGWDAAGDTVLSFFSLSARYIAAKGTPSIFSGMPGMSSPMCFL